jgi:hypothetical protein
MPDGSYRFMRQQRMFDVFADSVVGKHSPETDVILASVSNNSDTAIPDLLKAILQ